ncbi:MAG: hypothetical protein IH940_05560 [Acidobacteria bacterium]|nr:hypothetical protein [Acidobacteriota bacterium]
MASLRTEITEIVTGLGMLGYRDLKQALEVRPGHILNVAEAHFDRLSAAYESGDHLAEFELAWDNGATFARAQDGLRGRPPWTIEWKGPHRPPGYEQVPVDLRIDHVYLVSCKYGSNILHNVAPAHLFDRLLAERRGDREDWFGVVAPEAYQALYETYRAEAGLDDLPADVTALSAEDRSVIKAGSSRGLWPGLSQNAYNDFTLAVARGSAQRWLDAMCTATDREEMFWRIIRLQASPYFVLGASVDAAPLRYRVGTPWDFRNAFELRTFDAWADPAGQPLVRWRADMVDRHDGRRSATEGHVEVRWSHGKFGGMPEAKVKLDTAHDAVAGYFTLS